MKPRSIIEIEDYIEDHNLPFYTGYDGYSLYIQINENFNDPCDEVREFIQYMYPYASDIEIEHILEDISRTYDGGQWYDVREQELKYMHEIDNNLHILLVDPDSDITLLNDAYYNVESICSLEIYIDEDLYIYEFDEIVLHNCNDSYNYLDAALEIVRNIYADRYVINNTNYVLCESAITLKPIHGMTKDLDEYSSYIKIIEKAVSGHTPAVTIYIPEKEV